jgi:hypothetical protein
MRVAAALAFLSALLSAHPLLAQEPPPRIPLFVVDVHGNWTRFPSDDQALADSRGMSLAELPGAGFGLDVAVHVYPLKWKVVTFGLGCGLIVSRSSQTPDAATIAAAMESNLPVPRSATESLKSFTPQLSLNFGNGNGWSYISGGLGQTMWALTPAGQEGFATDTEPLTTLNYGGGARWFMKRHVGFSFDIRIYSMDKSVLPTGLPASPHTNITVISAGVSLK